MHKLRQLDFTIAELLGWVWVEVDKDVSRNPDYPKYEKTKAMLSPGQKRLADNCEWMHLTCDDIQEVPYYSTDPFACYDLDREMRERGFVLYLRCFRSDILNNWPWIAKYLPCEKWCTANAEAEARARAAIAALEKGVG